MARYLFIVSRAHPGLYDVLRERFGGDRNVEVILDRRVGERRKRNRRERVRSDRRTHPDIDIELKSRSYAVVERSGHNPPATLSR